MAEFYTQKEFEETANFIRSRIRYSPTMGLILGSGLSPLADEVAEPDVIPYEHIPHFPVSTVEGHYGRLIIGRLEGHDVLIMQGRAHYYEGYPMQQVTFPVRVMQVMGIHTLVVTNAAGGINPAFRAGDLMLITDHINLVGMAGANPLRGPNDPQLGPRFPDMSEAYDRELRRLTLKVAGRLNLTLQQGVYVMAAGPTFETGADIRFLQSIGADAVGMSTVPEVIVANHGGIRVLGISGISNIAGPSHSSTTETPHEEVLEAGRVIVPKLIALIKGILGEIKDAS